MVSSLRKYYKLLYAGYVVARLHATSYLFASVSSFFWFLIIMLPAVHYSDRPEHLVLVFVPAYLAMFVASIGSNTATEFLRWLVYEGLTDVYREAGLGPFHYTVSTWFFDFLAAFLSFSLLATVLGEYTGLGSTWFIENMNPVVLPLLVTASFSVEIFFGGLTALVYTHTRLGASFQGLLQMVLAVSAFMPLWRIPYPVLGLANPAAFLAEIARLLYGVSTVEHVVLYLLSPLLLATYFLVGYAMYMASDKVLARYGVEFRV